MGVGEQDRADVGEGVADSGEVLAQLLEVARQACIHEQEAGGVADQVEVDHVVAEAVDARCDGAGEGELAHVLLRRGGGPENDAVAQLTGGAMKLRRLEVAGQGAGVMSFRGARAGRGRQSGV